MPSRFHGADLRSRAAEILHENDMGRWTRAAPTLYPHQWLCLDYDVRGRSSSRVRTFAGFAPLIAGIAEPGIRERQLAELYSEHFLADRGLRWPLIPTTSPREAAFDSRRYWRGPVWPVITWVLWRVLNSAGEHERAEKLRRAAVEQIRVTGFTEYIEPFTGEALGSDNQSWTAAVVLGWLAHQRLRTDEAHVRKVGMEPPGVPRQQPVTGDSRMGSDVKVG